MYRVFPHWGNEGESPPPAKNLLIPSPPRKISRGRLPTSDQIFTPPPPSPPTTKQQFSSHKPIKTTFLTVAVTLAPFLF